MEKLLGKINGMLTEEKNTFYLFNGTMEELEESASLLNEAIPLSQYRDWYKKLKSMKVDYRSRFDSWFTVKKDEQGRRLGSKYRVYIPYGGKVASTRPITAPKDIVSALEKEGWEVKDYTKGMAIKKGGDKKDIKAEEWNSEKQYKALDFVKYNGKTFKAIKNPTVGVSPSDNKERQWLDFEKVAGGKEKNVEKGIGSILADLASSAKKSGNVEMEKFYSGLERKNQTLQMRVQNKGKDTTSVGEAPSKYIVISRHPYDVMGASSDRGWASCQNVGVGQEDYTTTQKRGKVKEYIKDKEYKRDDMVIFGNKVYISRDTNKGIEPDSNSSKWSIDDTFKVASTKDRETGKINKVAVRQFEKESGRCKLGRPGAYYHGIGGDVRFGAMVAYVVDADDKNINNPHLRMLIKPYVKMDGKNAGSVYLFASSSQYGSQSGSRATEDKIFKKTVDDWLEEHQTGEGVYQIKQKSISSSEPLETQKWEYHYPEEPKELTAKNYKANESNVHKFRDGLTWDEVIDQHRWFAKNTFSGVEIGEEYGKLIMYKGNVTNGTWEDDAEALGGNLSNIFVDRGSFKDVSLDTCEITVGTFDKCNIFNTKLKIRSKITNSNVDKSEITGSINSTNSEYKNVKFGSIPEESKLIFKNCTFEKCTDLVGTFDDCTFKDGVTLSKKVNIINATYDGINQDGGSFSGTLKSGNLKNVDIPKIVMKGGTLINCDIKHGIIENGTLKNCDFHAGRFGYTPKLGSKNVEKLARSSYRNRSKFFGGNFFGGTFEGGDFIKGTWHKGAKWLGGYWHSGENKPLNAKTKDGYKINKNIDIKGRLEAKTKKEEE